MVEVCLRENAMTPFVDIHVTTCLVVLDNMGECMVESRMARAGETTFEIRFRDSAVAEVYVAGTTSLQRPAFIQTTDLFLGSGVPFIYHAGIFSVEPKEENTCVKFRASCVAPALNPSHFLSVFHSGGGGDPISLPRPLMQY